MRRQADQFPIPTGWRLRRLIWRSRLQRVRNAIRHIWWRWTSERPRALADLQARKEDAAFRFEQARKAWDIAYQLRYPPTGAGGALQIAAAEIDGQSPGHPCEHCDIEPDTNAANCDRERRGETCWCNVADELRAFDKAWSDLAAFNQAALDAALEKDRAS